MHLVIKHLFARKNKKVPVKDGRNIVLVNFGGFMTGAYSAGAMLALVEMGYQGAFDEIYTISSGFHNACSFLSGDGKRNTSVYYEDLCTDGFFNPKRIWKIIDVENLVDILKNKKPINVNKIYGQHTKLFVRLQNKNKSPEEYLEVHKIPRKKFDNLIRAAASIPYLVPGYVKLGSSEYKDPLWLNRQMLSHIKHVLQTKATDIFIIYNQYSQFEYVKRSVNNIFNDRIMHVYPGKTSQLSRFENRPKVIKKAVMLMGKKVKNLFGLKSGIHLYESK